MADIRLSIRRVERTLWSYEVETIYGTLRLNRPGVARWCQGHGQHELAGIYDAIQTVERIRHHQIWNRLNQLEGRISNVLFKLGTILGGLE
jgi:hypothetical protein